METVNNDEKDEGFSFLNCGVTNFYWWDGSGKGEELGTRDFKIPPTHPCEFESPQKRDIVQTSKQNLTRKLEEIQKGAHITFYNSLNA